MIKISTQCPVCGRYRTNCDSFCPNCGKQLSVTATLHTISKCYDCPCKNNCKILKNFVK